MLIAPLMLCGSQLVAAIDSFTVAPSFRPIRSRIVVFLLRWRACLAPGAAFLLALVPPRGIALAPTGASWVPLCGMGAGGARRSLGSART